MQEDVYDVAIVGAGYGGAPLGALLARSGRRVLLVDKTPHAGGKTQTLRRKGWRYEMFGAVGIPGEGSRFHDLVDVLGIADRAPFLIPTGDIAGVRYKAPDGSWRASKGPARQSAEPEALDNLKRLYDATDDDLGALGNLFLTALALSGDALDALDDTGMLEWMRGFGLPTGLLSQLCATMNMLFVVPVDRLCASEGALTLAQLALGGAGRYHAGGYGHVAEVCAQYVVEHGGAYTTGRRVRRIVVERGQACGIELDGRIARARVVASNAGIQPTVLSLTGAEHFPADYVERVRGLVPSWGLAGVRYVLDTQVFDAALTPIYSDASWLDSERFSRMLDGDWPDVPLIAIDSPSVFDPDLVPPGCQIAATQVFVPADPTDPRAAEVTREAIRRSELVLEELWPGFRAHVVRTEPYGPRHVSRMTRDGVVPGQGGEAVGLAQIVGQCGRSRPDPRTPLPGLFLVGADAGGRGAGTHMAVDSAFNVAALIDTELG